jgi:membrane carboxypeptidase/penicillin-binding protein
VSVEDKRFFRHFGVDVIGFGRAIIENIKTRSFAEGASTLTQQLTRGLFLSTDKKIDRKIKEWMLAIQIEQTYRQEANAQIFDQIEQQLRYVGVPGDVLEKLQPLREQSISPNTDLVVTLQETLGSELFAQYRAPLLEHLARLGDSQRQAKEHILELYANQFYWGHGAYGVQAAARIYFGKEVEDLTLGESAMLAGLVQLPAVYSPITNPERAKNRQAHVLRRMVIEGYIEEGRFQLTTEALARLRYALSQMEPPADTEVGAAAISAPEALLPKLETLKNQPFDTEEAFLQALTRAIGPDNLGHYRTPILIQAAEPVFKLAGRDIDRLKALALPETVTQKLAALLDAVSLPKEDFIAALERAIGRDSTQEYLPLILQYAARDTAKRARVEPFTRQEIPERQIDEAPYFVEHVRQYLEERYGFRVYEDGLQVYTTLDLHLQHTATAALQKGLRTIQKRHGYRVIDRDRTPAQREEKLKVIRATQWRKPPERGDFLHAVVSGVSGSAITVNLGAYTGTIGSKGFEWTGREAGQLVKVDDIVLVEVLEVDSANQTVRLALDQEPALEGAILAIDPKTGHILAMVGGYDFARSKFNRAVQALRQPGSSFKPIVYLTALERGRTPSDIIVDEPTTFLIDPRTEQTWTPKNFSADHKGPMTLRRALEASINVVAAKLIDQIGPRAVIETSRRLGIMAQLHPYPALALGSSEVPLIEMTSAYGTFANRGYRVDPIFVTKVLDRDGNVLEENVPRARQVLGEDVTYVLVSMMQGVVERGTATAARALGRPLAGKTGTTNDSTDALFVGFSPSLTAGVWVGYDENRKSIGRNETGGRAALPIWIEFMQEALKDTPIEEFPVPAGISFVQVDAASGLLYDARCGEAFTEAFIKGTEPKEYCYHFNPYRYLANP